MNLFQKLWAKLKSATTGKPVLRYASGGEPVKELQRILKAQGFFDGDIGGNFGQVTHKAVRAFQQTHIGPDRKPLNPDGVVGPATWWALANPSGPAQRQNIVAPASDHNLSTGRLLALDQCRKLHAKGIQERPDGANTGGGVEVFHKWFQMSPAPWCAMVFNWIVYQALNRLPWGIKIAHVKTLYQACQKRGLAKAVGSGYRPRPGDGFVMVHPDSTGHIGMIAAVSEDWQTLQVYEGNSGNRFALREREVGAGNHVGYINCWGDIDQAPQFKQGLTARAEAATNQTR